MDLIRDQYEAFPYPARDPAEEDRRLVTGSPSHLAEIDHYLFGGRRDWSKPFRALIAGGGTGDGCIQLAQHLAWTGTPAEIVYLDLSTASRKIAEARAARRGLDSIRFETGSLLDAPSLGKFDYIDCCGVLHHLPEPARGLSALRQCLAPSGGLGLMLYGRLGRSGVYEAQTILKEVAPVSEPAAKRLEQARRLLGSLPPTNALKRNPFVADHLNGGEAGLFDLLLNPIDQAYTVPEIFTLLDGADLRHVSFIAPARYAPETYLGEAFPQLKALTPEKRGAIAEMVAGNLKTHVFYAAPKDGSAATALYAPDLTPVLREPIAEALARAIAQSGRLGGSFDGFRLSVPMPPLAPAIIRSIDGRTTVEELAQGLRKAGTSREQAGKEIAETLARLIALNLACFSHASVART
ncbi:MAG: methyltransferase [Alphaproteobacteria bacterium]|nr:methyltransferase [Alphaproteobacteria bacterium]